MAFSEEEKQAVWEKGEVVHGYNADIYRKDQCGAWMQRDQHGNRNNGLGWEIDHIVHDSKGGTDAPSNLRPLQWENNASRQDGRLTCPVTAEGEWKY